MPDFRAIQLVRASGFVALLIAAASCATGHRTESSSPSREYELRRLIPYTLKVRRPTSPGADPKAGPGGVDYHSAPLPDENFDCRDPEWLFREINLTEARECLAALSAPAAPNAADTERKIHHLFFTVRWLPVPELELDASKFKEERSADCLVKAFGHLPLPREIFYQSNDLGQLACYSSRLAVESNEVGGFKLPINKTALRVELPFKPVPKNDAEMRMLLMTWALTPYWDSKKNTLSAHIVPDAICRRCLGEKTMLGPTDPEPISWPSEVFPTR
jgi:hypothetical protein